jgi:hypothetical protein
MKLYNNNIPLNVYDIIYSNSNNIHKKLFDEALYKYCKTNNIDKRNYKIIDKENEDDKLKPSIAVMMSNEGVDYIDLTDYWNKNYVENLNKYSENELFRELLIEDDNKKHIEVEFIDYVRGRVQFRNKFTNKKFFVNFNKLDRNRNYYPELKNTFTALYYA